MEERFWSKVNKTDTCWLWTAYCDKAGYGRIAVDKRWMLAHRVSWLIADRTIPEGLLIRHKCRSKNCVNPEHLETGTSAQNATDMIRDGTSTRGIKNPQAKLTEEQVREIRARSTENQRLLGEEFGVSRVAITDIISGKRWAWLS